MIDSRKLEDLHPDVEALARRHIASLQAVGIRTLVTSTLRDFAAQDALYALGRTKPGKKVTNARAGQSWHNYGLAYDIYPMVLGKPVWGTRSPSDRKLWNKVGLMGESLGLEWSGRWTKFPEMAHFQFRDGMTIANAVARHNTKQELLPGWRLDGTGIRKV
jgi:peptidoglycan L-alanyl-D-glutamate endopeptidase CwlK